MAGCSGSGWRSSSLPGVALNEFQSRVTIDPQKLAGFLRGPQSGVLRHELEVGAAVKRIAQRKVGVYRPEPGDPFAARRISRRRPGTLRDSIVVRVADRGAGLPSVMVGSDDPIALLHHDGTPPHVIRARRKPMLVFYSHGAIRVVKSVRHPGTKPNRYLTDALREVRR